MTPSRAPRYLSLRVLFLSLPVLQTLPVLGLPSFIGSSYCGLLLAPAGLTTLRFTGVWFVSSAQ